MPRPGESGEGGLQRLTGIPLEDREPEAMQGGGPGPALERPQATRQVDAGRRPRRALDERDRRGAQDHEIEAAGGEVDHGLLEVRVEQRADRDDEGLGRQHAPRHERDIRSHVAEHHVGAEERLEQALVLRASGARANPAERPAVLDQPDPILPRKVRPGQ